jgi:hypothetical protein
MEGKMAECTTPKPAVVRCDSWAGRYDVPVDVIGETPARYRVRVLDNARWPGRNQSVKPGDIKLCPKRVVRFLLPEEVQREPQRRVRFLGDIKA